MGTSAHTTSASRGTAGRADQQCHAHRLDLRLGRLGRGPAGGDGAAPAGHAQRAALRGAVRGTGEGRASVVGARARAPRPGAADRRRARARPVVPLLVRVRQVPRRARGPGERAAVARRPRRRRARRGRGRAAESVPRDVRRPPGAAARLPAAPRRPRALPVLPDRCAAAGEVLARAALDEGAGDVWTYFDHANPSLAEVLTRLCSPWGVVPKIVDQPMVGRVSRLLARPDGYAARDARVHRAVARDPGRDAQPAPGRPAALPARLHRGDRQGTPTQSTRDERDYDPLDRHRAAPRVPLLLGGQLRRGRARPLVGDVVVARRRPGRAWPARLHPAAAADGALGDRLQLRLRRLLQLPPVPQPLRALPPRARAPGLRGRGRDARLLRGCRAAATGAAQARHGAPAHARRAADGARVPPPAAAAGGARR